MSTAKADEEQALLFDADDAERKALPKRDNMDSWLRTALVVGACVTWMMVSSLLIIVNKHIMVDLHFHFPMAVSGMGMVVSSVCSFLCCRVFKLVDAKQSLDLNFYLTKIMPVGFFMALTLLTGNQVYMYLSVSFIQMLKAFTPVITMLALFIARLEDPTKRLVYSVLTISLGTAVSAYGEVNMSIIGMICMFSSETAESIRLVLTQYLLQGLKFHPIEGLMYMAPACAVWLTFGVWFYELPRINSEGAWLIVAGNKLEFAAAACMGFAVNGIAYTVIKLAGSLTLKVLGTVKNSLLVVVGVIFLQEVVTQTQSIGYAMSLAGFVWYNQIKMTQA